MGCWLRMRFDNVGSEEWESLCIARSGTIRSDARKHLTHIFFSVPFPSYE
jgi:hypothetical protein